MQNDSKKVIWLICKYASPIKYYFGTRHFYLAQEWVKMNYDVYIFTSNSNHLTKALPRFRGKYLEERINGIKTVWLNTYQSKNNSGISRIISWFHFEWQVLTLSKKRILKPDLIIVSSLSLLSVISGFLLSKKYHSKFILEIRDIWPLSIIKLGNYSKYHPFILFLAWIEKLGYRKADAIVGTMPNLEEHVREVTTKYHKVACIPQGINLDFYSNQKLLSKKYLADTFPKNKFIVAYIGTINPNNPISILLETAKSLRENEKIYFVILGDGTQKRELQTKYKALSNVKFLGPIPKEKVHHFLQYVDVCFDAIDSDIAKYGLSRNKWIDYMYAAKPIICSFSGFQSMINEANAGTYVPYGDIEALKKEIVRYSEMDKDKLVKMGLRGKDFIMKSRTFQRLAGDFLNLVEF